MGHGCSASVCALLQQRNVEKCILDPLAESHWQIDQLQLLFQTAMFCAEI